MHTRQGWWDDLRSTGVIAVPLIAAAWMVVKVLTILYVWGW